MVHTSSDPAADAKPPPFQVEAPRAGDAIGVALRDAFARDPGLPEDMVAMLRHLNNGVMSAQTHQSGRSDPSNSPDRR